jgi:hypothetical protein
LEVLLVPESLRNPRVNTDVHPWTKAHATAKLAP